MEIRGGNAVTCTGVAQDYGALLLTLNRLRTADGVTDVNCRELAENRPCNSRSISPTATRNDGNEDPPQFAGRADHCGRGVARRRTAALRAAGELVVGAVQQICELRRQVSDEMLLQRQRFLRSRSEQMRTDALLPDTSLAEQQVSRI